MDVTERKVWTATPEQITKQLIVVDAEPGKLLSAVRRRALRLGDVACSQLVHLGWTRRRLRRYFDRNLNWSVKSASGVVQMISESEVGENR